MDESLNKKENDFKNFCKFPKMTYEKIFKIVVLIIMTALMLVNCYTGIFYARIEGVSCIKDRTHVITESINDFLLRHDIFCMIIKLIFAVLIDFTIIYTLFVWSLYSDNIRILSSGITFILFNLLCRFIHIQIQPNNSSFYNKYIFSIFVNYKKTTYSFYPLLNGILVICALEWKRNNANIIFWIIFSLMIAESIILLVMQGNYYHELFTSTLFGHYFFMMNEKVLTYFFGDEYLNKNKERKIKKINLDDNEKQFDTNEGEDEEEENIKMKSEEKSELAKIQ